MESWSCRLDVQVSEYEVPDSPVGYMQTGKHEGVELPGAASWLYASS